jgi:hypothetical protein
MGTSDHLRGVGNAGSMFKTSRRVSFCDRLVGSPPNRTFSPSYQVPGSRCCPCPIFSCPSCHEKVVAQEYP